VHLLGRTRAVRVLRASVHSTLVMRSTMGCRTVQSGGALVAFGHAHDSAIRREGEVQARTPSGNSHVRCWPISVGRGSDLTLDRGARSEREASSESRRKPDAGIWASLDSGRLVLASRRRSSYPIDERIRPAVERALANVRERQQALLKTPTLAGAFACMWRDGVHPL
jgi:hypothetical protein